jgi:putative flippase GtrA
MKQKEKNKVMAGAKSFYTFAKAQVSAFIGGVSDYLIMIGLTELTGLHYTLSIFFSGTMGAIINFSINRYWSFTLQGSTNSPLSAQLSRFIIVVAGSIFLKSAGTFLFTSFLKLDYRISRLVIDLIVSYGFNYTLLKKWVFKTQLN